MSLPILEIKNLNVDFFLNGDKLRAVDGLSLTIKLGEIIGLVGESGCGKTMTALSILRLVPPPGKITFGEIYWYAKDILKKSNREMREVRGSQIGMIFQDPFSSLNPVLTIGEQITEGLIFHKKMNKKQAKESAIEMMKKTKIPDPQRIFKSYPQELSGGMRQRAMIAMMIALEPKLLIADEPTTALDVTIQHQILELLKELKENFNMSILFITHNFGLVAKLCDFCAVMYAGKIIEYASTRQLFTNPLHPYTQALLAAVPQLNRGKLKNIPGFPPTMKEVIPGCSFAPRCDLKGILCFEREPRFKEVEPGHWVSCYEITDEHR